MNFNLRTELPTTYRYAVLMSIYILSKGLQYTRMHRYRGPRLLMHAVCAAWGRVLRDRFQSILRIIAGERLLLAPLDSATRLGRLHRHVVVLEPKDNDHHDDGLLTIMSLNLPFEGTPASSEGVTAFLQNVIGGCLLDIDSLELSRILMGDSTAIPVSHHRRSLWMDIRANETTTTVLQGLQYTVAGHEADFKGVSLENILPTLSSLSCPLLDGEQSPEIELRLPPDFKGSLSGVPLLQKRIINDGGQSLHYALNYENIRNKRLVLDYTTNEGAAASDQDFLLERTIQRPTGVANQGAFMTKITNSHQKCNAQVHVIEILPTRYVRVDWSTLLVSSPTAVDKYLSLEADDMIRFEWNTTLPPRTIGSSKFNYEPAFLGFQQFPGDPNRGMEVPPALAHVTLACSNDPTADRSPQTFFSDPLLLLPPVPDMSMPFNVISLTCTLYAFIIGSVVNLLVRKSSERLKYKLHPELKPKSKLAKLKERLRAKFGGAKSQPKSESELDEKQKSD
jgi:hypothetical protein